jgi:hypothetical protein
MADSRFLHLRTNVLLRLDRKAGLRFELAYLPCEICNHVCADSSDRVYSLLGLMSDLNEMPVHYGETSTRTMMHVAEVTLLRDKKLNVRSHISPPSINSQDSQRSAKPSWLPTYNSDRIHLLLCDKRRWQFAVGRADEPAIQQLPDRSNVVGRTRIRDHWVTLS